MIVQTQRITNRRIIARFVATALVAAVFGSLTSVTRAQNTNAFFDRFSEHVQKSDSIDDKARKLIAGAIDEVGDADPEIVLVEALVVMSPPFLKAMDHYDEEEYVAAIEALRPLTDADDPYVRLNAEAYMVRSLVAADKLVKAADRIEKIQADRDALAAHTFAEAEMVYLLGYCQVQSLEFDKGQLTLEQFLADYPDAPQRYVVTARQMLAELARRIPESIGEVADLMQFSQKRLVNADTGETVQQAQQRVLDLLDDLIEDAQKREQQQQQSSQQQQQQQQQKQNQQQQNQQQQQDPSQPMPDSRTNPNRGNLGEKRPGRVVNPGESWGAMPDAQREKVLQVLRESFPGRYRELVEQYYESLAEQP